MSATALSEAIVKEVSIKAAADRVFDALTDPSQIVAWWGIEGRFQVTDMQRDLKPGGQWTMRGDSAGGRTFTISGRYCEIDRPRLLAFTWQPSWSPDAGESLVRFDLTEQQGITRVRLTHSGLTSDAARAQHQGWDALLAKLRAFSEVDGTRP